MTVAGSVTCHRRLDGDWFPVAAVHDRRRFCHLPSQARRGLVPCVAAVYDRRWFCHLPSQARRRDWFPVAAVYDRRWLQEKTTRPMAAFAMSSRRRAGSCLDIRSMLTPPTLHVHESRVLRLRL